MSSRIRDLAQILSDADDRRPHLDTIRRRMDTGALWAGLGRLQRELAEEMAASLGRAARRVSDALESLERLGRAVGDCRAGAPDPERLEQLVAEFNEQRETALRLVRDLKIQREALSLRRHDELDRQYPVPERMRA